MHYGDKLAQYKREALEIANKRKIFLIFGLVLFIAFVIFLVIGIIVLIGAVDGDLHYQAAAILLIFSFLALAGSVVMWILRRTLFDKKLTEIQVLINKTIKEMTTNKGN